MFSMPCRNICSKIGSSFGYYSGDKLTAEGVKYTYFHDGYTAML